MSSRDKKGWLSVLGCSAAIFWSGALIFGYPGLMGPYWQKLFEVDAGAIGRILTFVLISLGFFMFFAGKWHMKIGTNNSIRVGTFILIVSLLILNYAQNIYMVYIWAFLNGTASCFIYVPGLATVQKWFPQRRGLVSGIVNLVFGISAAIMSPIFNVMFHSFGYTMMNYVVIVLVLIVNLLASLVSEMPEKAKLTDAEKAEHENLLASIQAKAAKSSQNQVMGSFTVTEALKTKSFWFIWLTWALMGAAGINMVSLSVNYSVSLGLAGVVALTAFNITNGLSRIIAGILTDLIGGNLTGCFAFALAAIGYFLLPEFTSITGIAVLAAFVGFAFGTLFAITAPMASGIFGLENFGMIFGLIFSAYGFVGGLIGPALSGYILKTNGGNFTPVFIYLGVFCLLSAFFIMFARPIPIKQAGTEQVQGAKA
ncbi:MAG TPA: MFS transporter [Fervidobacterium sp.]|nr:MFS transporter [Fervidobacterium sp.]